MCGIAGIIGREPLTPETVSRVKRMNEELTHRGPDGEGLFHDGSTALAMRRLSVIDVGGGWQPLYNEDRSLVLVANGEIYNFIELRSSLERRGHRFRSGSDCETILHLYEEHGRRCVDYLRGMFAFALWDRKTGRLLLGRDRMGEKPLYLFEAPEGLVFASELKALLRSGMVPFELDPGSVDLFFHYQYVPDPLTLVRGVRRLRAGHTLEVSRHPWRMEETGYWRMEEAPALAGNPPDVIRNALEDLGGVMTRSDVPVGIALSGGLDSSLVAALAAKYYSGVVHAFSVGYPGRPPHDERTDAKAFADHLGIPFHDIEIHQDAMVESFDKLNYWRDEPIADISGYGYYAVMRCAADLGIKVMLQGQGGDELFWGYPWLRNAVKHSQRKAALRLDGSVGALHYWDDTFEWPRLTPRAVAWWLRTLASRCGRGWKNYKRDRMSPAEHLVFYDLTPDFQSARTDLPHVYGQDFMDRLEPSSPYAPFTCSQPWPQLDVLMTRLACETYLLGNGITQGDRLSMASSVELRLPLLDHQLVETVIGLRKNRPDSALAPKAWLREAVKGFIPPWVLDRPKRGFEPPRRQWHQAIFAVYGDWLHDGYLVKEGILTPPAAKSLALGPFPAEAGTPLSFKALVLETWCRQMSCLADTGRAVSYERFASATT